MIEREKLVSMVRRLQRGEETAAAEIYETFQQDVYYSILKTVKNDATLAEDLTQDTFIEVLEKIGDLQEPAAFVTWIHQIAYHKCTAYFRKRHEILADENEDGYTVFDTAEEEREEFIPGAAMATLETRKIIVELLEGIPGDQKEALIRFYFNEMSLKEIAEVLGISEGTVKSRLHYGKKAMKKSIEDFEKKHDIRLHSVGVGPLLLWLFKCYRVEEKISQTKNTAGQILRLGEESAAAVVAGGAAAATAAASTVETAGVAAAAGASAAVQTAVGTGAAVAGKAITAKVAAGILAAVVALGGAGAGVAALVNGGEPEPTIPRETLATEFQGSAGEEAVTIPTGKTEETEAADATETMETKETEPGHTHTYEIVEVLLPSCTGDGFSTYLCDCGDSYQGDYKGALGHAQVETDRAEPQVGIDGYVEYTCTNCGEVSREVIPALTEEGEHYHVKLHEMVGATCTQDGYVRETCTECGEELRYEVIEATGHENEIIFQMNTCTQDGYEGHVCTKCGVQTDYMVLPATGHTPYAELSRVEPQPGVAGYVEYQCFCGDVYREALEALPEDSGDAAECEHDWDYFAKYEEELVYEDRTCKICGAHEILYQQDNNACAHEWYYWTYTGNEFIHEMRTCELCGQEEAVSVTANPCEHQWYRYTEEQANGEIYTYEACSVCGQYSRIMDP